MTRVIRSKEFQSVLAQRQLEEMIPKPHFKVTSRNEVPDRRNFSIIPKMCPDLRPFIKEADWNAAEKKIRLRVEEHSAFKAFNWLTTMNERRKTLEGSPFADLEQDALVLRIFDANDHELIRFKLNGLELLQHTCKLTDEPDSEDHKPLTHDVLLGYDAVEILEIDRSNEDEIPLHDGVADEEWSEIKLEVESADFRYERPTT